MTKGASELLARCTRALRDAGHDVPVHRHLEVGLVLCGESERDPLALIDALGLRGPAAQIVAADDAQAKTLGLAKQWLDEGIATSLLVVTKDAAELWETDGMTRARRHTTDGTGA